MKKLFDKLYSSITKLFKRTDKIKRYVDKQQLTFSEVSNYLDTVYVQQPHALFFVIPDNYINTIVESLNKLMKCFDTSDTDGLIDMKDELSEHLKVCETLSQPTNHRELNSMLLKDLGINSLDDRKEATKRLDDFKRNVIDKLKDGFKIDKVVKKFKTKESYGRYNTEVLIHKNIIKAQLLVNYLLRANQSFLQILSELTIVMVTMTTSIK